MGSMLGLIVALVLGPISEELVFRGIVLRGFLQQYSMRKAIVASSVLFGLFHLNPWHWPSATLGGMLFAWWFVRTRSLIPCILGHALHNTLVVAVIYATQFKTEGLMGELAQLTELQPVWLSFVGLALAAFGLWLLQRSFRRTDTGRGIQLLDDSLYQRLERAG